MALDKFLVLSFLGGLLALGLATNAPFFEQFGRGRLTYYTVWALPLVLVVLLLKRASSAQVGRFLFDWWPVVGVLAVYESLKHMHANRITEWLGIAPKDALMLKIDEVLFFGKTLPLYMDTWTAPWFLRLMTFSYIWIYYAGPVILLGYAYVFRDQTNAFRRLRLGIILGLLGGYVIYLLVPVAGPLFLVGDQFTQPIPSQSRLANLVFDTLRFNWDCFPSLHTAIPWLLTALAWRGVSRLGRAACVIGSLCVTLSTVALRFHYGIDLIAGFAWAAIVYYAVEALEGREYGSVRLPKLRLLGTISRLGLAQWPVIASIWMIYALALMTVSTSIVLATPILLGQKLAVLFFVLFTLAAEAGVLVLANCGFEGLCRRRPEWSTWTDALRGLMLGVLVTALVGSLLKFGQTGAHLRAADLPFLSPVAGAPGLSLGLRLSLALLLLVATAGMVAGLRKLRSRSTSVEPKQMLMLLALVAAGSAFTYRTYPAVRSFATHVIPEFTWLFGG